MLEVNFFYCILIYLSSFIDELFILIYIENIIMNWFNIEENGVWNFEFRSTKIWEFMILGVCSERERERERDVLGKKRVG